MATKRRGGLGRGLDKLIPNKSAFSDSAKSKVSPDNGVKTTNTEMAPEDSSIRNESQNNDSEMAISEPIQEIMEEKSESGNQLGSDMISSDKSTDSNDSYSETEDEIASSTEDVYDSSSESNDKGDSVLIMKISSVEPNRDQPRKHFSEEGIEELASSIKQYGIIQPLLVQKREDYYEIIAGERRWRAARMAGLSEIPVVIVDGDDLKVAQISLVENIQRENLNPVEEAFAYQVLIDKFNLTQEQLSREVGKSRSTIANMLRLIDLPEEVLLLLKDGKITNGHARAILGLNDEEKMILLAQKTVERDLSVREVEKIVRRMLINEEIEEIKSTDNNAAQRRVYMRELEKRAMDRLGRRVKINQTTKKKTVELTFDNDSDLEELLTLICGNNFFNV